MIRRRVNEFEDTLTGRYSQPQVLPIPDELDPEVPRILFDSKHGFSQIVISQINMSLNVSYSSDWQSDIGRGRNYLTERVPTLFDLVGILDEKQRVHYSGIVTRARLASQEDDRTVISHMSRIFQLGQDETVLHDLEIRKAETLSERFFSNVSIKNYRTWQIPEDSPFRPPRMNDNQIIERGIEITGDFNDRYKYNQDSSYFSGRTLATEIIDRGIEIVERLTSKMTE